VKKLWLAPHGGAVSSTLPWQVSVAEPNGPSAVTGLPAPGPWRQGTADVVPPGEGTVFVTLRPVTLKAGSRFWTTNVHVKMAPGAADGGQLLETPMPVVLVGGVGVGVP
jgi:hypothetical protein